MAYYSNIYVADVLVSPAGAKNNTLSTLLDSSGNKIGTFLLI